MRFAPSISDSVLLASIGEEDFLSLFEASRTTRFQKGVTIFSEGDPGTSVMLIESGRAEVSITSQSGRKSVLAHMGPGEVLGEIAALDGGGRTATAIAASNIVVKVLARDNVMEFVSERPKVATAVIEELCKKTRNATEMYAVQAIHEGPERLARVLLRLFDKWGQSDAKGIRLEERFSQNDIGDFCGLARENVNRLLKSWADDRVLAFEGRQLILLDRDALEILADGDDADFG